MPSTDVQTPMGRLQAVTIRTEDPQILDAMIISVSVDVIQFNGDPPICSLHFPTTQLATRRLQSNPEETFLELVTCVVTVGREQLIQGNHGSTNTLHPTIPALAGEVFVWDSEPVKVATQVRIVPTLPLQPKPLEHHSEAGCPDRGFAKLRIRPFSPPHARQPQRDACQFSAQCTRDVDRTNSKQIVDWPTTSTHARHPGPTKSTRTLKARALNLRVRNRALVPVTSAAG